MTATGVSPAMRLVLTGLPLGVLVLWVAPRLSPGNPTGGQALALGVQTVMTLAAALVLSRDYPFRRLGPANLVTLVRLSLTAALSAALVAQPSTQILWHVTGIAVLCLVLDGMDGWIARRTGLVSGFGARFDMETDSLLALMLAVIAFRSGDGGALALVLGLPRYVFAAAALLLPALARPLPERIGRKAVCVVQIAALVLIVSPATGAAASTLLALAALAALAWSFGRDIAFLCR